MSGQQARHYHYAAADRPDALAALADSPAHGLFLDLEDGVLEANKADAREAAHSFAEQAAHGGRPTLLRVNVVGSEHWAADVARCAPLFDRLILPLLTGPEAVVEAHAALASLEREHGLPAGSRRLYVLIETAAAVLRLGEIVSASPRIDGILFGQADFTLSIGTQGIAGGSFRPPLVAEHVHSLLVLHARAAGLELVTLPWVAATDHEGHVREMRRLFALGYDAMIVGSGAAVPRVDEAWRPAEEDLAFARAVRDVYDRAVAAGSGSDTYEGWLVEGAFVRIADRTLERGGQPES